MCSDNASETRDGRVEGALQERSGFCWGWLPSLEPATVLSRLLCRPSPGPRVVNWFQRVLL